MKPQTFEVIFLQNDKGNNFSVSDIMVATNIDIPGNWKNVMYSFPDYKTSISISDDESSKEFYINEGWLSSKSFDRIVNLLRNKENIIVSINYDVEKVQIIKPEEVGFIDPKITQTKEFLKEYEEKLEKRIKEFNDNYILEFDSEGNVINLLKIIKNNK